MKKYLLLPLFLLPFAFATAQTLDHLSLTSGGDATDEMNYILGEVLVFQLTDGNVFIDGGTIVGGDFPDGIMEIMKGREDCGLVNCYPNPARHQATVDFGGVEKASGLVVLDELGHVVLQVKPTDTKVTLDVQKLAVGTYYVALLDGKRVVCVNKFVKY